MNSFHMMIEKQQNNSTTTTSCNIHSPASLLHRLLLSLANLSRKHSHKVQVQTHCVVSM
jgi:hypothetical protein